MTTHNLQKLRVQDPVLTELAQGYHNNELVAETLMPTVEIEKEAGKIPTFGRLAFDCLLPCVTCVVHLTV